MTLAVWKRATDVYAGLIATGKPAEDADIFIASYCIINNYVLVTNNTKHFDDIKELKIINWK